VIRVLGLGNVLMGDDGFGPFVVRVMEATYDADERIEFVDVGTPGLDLTPYLLGADAVIFVDTVKASGEPGELRVYDKSDILRHPPQARTGGHDPALKEAILTVDAVGGGPKFVTLVGVIPAWVATGVELSPALEAALGRAIGAIALVLDGLGVELKRRKQPLEPDIWWARESLVLNR
jgi:hydrogenase maturation protease